MQPVGILGGTFDPIHLGHIRLAQEACKQLHLKEVRLVPVNTPPHRKQPYADASDRKTMIDLAIADDNRLIIDCCELERTGPSYTVDTLNHLRSTMPDIPLCLIMGRDAFAQINQWSRWEQLLDYAHIIVASRPGNETTFDPLLTKWIDQHRTDDIESLSTSRNGRIYFLTIPELAISSTEVRDALITNQVPKGWLHESTLQYIQQHKLYQDAA